MQNRIALFEKRQRVYDDLDDYVNRQLISWEFDLSKVAFFDHYSSAYIGALFDDDIKNFRGYLEEISGQINVLQGDYDRAMEKGTCNGRNEMEIGAEIQRLNDEVLDKFRILKDDKFPKYFRL